MFALDQNQPHAYKLIEIVVNSQVEQNSILKGLAEVVKQNSDRVKVRYEIASAAWVLAPHSSQRACRVQAVKASANHPV